MESAEEMEPLPGAKPVRAFPVTTVGEIVVADCVPVTSPPRVPVNERAEIAEVALPWSVPVITPAWKLPLGSLFTRVAAVGLLVAASAMAAALATADAEAPPTLLTMVADCVPLTSPDSEPVNEAALVAAPCKFPMNVPVVMPESVKSLASLLEVTDPGASFAVVMALSAMFAVAKAVSANASGRLVSLPSSEVR